MNVSSKNIFIFDLDGTLTESKSILKEDMAKVLCTLIEKGNTVAVISGGNFHQFESQFLRHMQCTHGDFSRLYLLPTSGAQMYSWNTDKQKWNEEYSLPLKDEERKRIMDAFDRALKEVSFGVETPTSENGDLIEDRGTEITFSGLGQRAPLEEKENWDPTHAKRIELIGKLKKYIPEFEIRTGGMTSIDITSKGVDKAYGVNRFFDYTKQDKDSSVFFGDALFDGGNDFPVTTIGIDTVSVSGPEDTIQKLKKFVYE